MVYTVGVLFKKYLPSQSHKNPPLFCSKSFQVLLFAFVPLFHLIDCLLCWRGTSLIAQLVKNLPAMHETWDESLGQEDPLEKGTATYSSILA